MQSTVLIASLVIALISGCLPCSQVLQRLSSSKSCCTKTGSCKIPKPSAPQKCDLTISATEHIVVPDAPQVTPQWKSEGIESDFVAPKVMVASAVEIPGYSPPDLILLNSTILI